MPDNVSKRMDEIRERLAPALALGKWRQTKYNDKLQSAVTTSRPGISEGSRHVCDCGNGLRPIAETLDIAEFIAHAPEDIGWLLDQVGIMLGDTLADDLVDEGDGVQFLETEAWLPIGMCYDPSFSIDGTRSGPQLRIWRRKPENPDWRLAGVNAVFTGKTATAMRKELDIPCREDIEGELVVLAKKRVEEGGCSSDGRAAPGE